MTGFRFAYGGAQAYYGVTPDVCTLGKAIGGGFPLAAIAGRADIMAHFDKGAVAEDAFMVQIGTLSGNPIAAAAGLKTLEILKRPGAYERIFKTGRALMQGYAEILKRARVTARVVGDAPMFDVVFTDREVKDYRSALGDEAKMKRCNALLRAARHPEGREQVLHLARPHGRGRRLHARRLRRCNRRAAGRAGGVSPSAQPAKRRVTRAR